MPSQRNTAPKKPRAVLDNVFAFSPNRDTLGATAYLIVEKVVNILIDSPPWNDRTQAFLQEQGGVGCLFITHRGSIGKAAQIQAETGCEILIQEQEAYLLPEAKPTVFESEIALGDSAKGIWTPGHSPGSSCLYYSGGGGVLFSGRHLLPNRQGLPVPLRTVKTFHWPRQIRSVQTLLDRFTPETLSSICPGANTGFLRGQTAIADAYSKLWALDLDECLQAQPLL
ncbi:MBL fold metallo-hydrolase [Oscillatoriales cyanobacterium LEGE 11467]|uniref:MBL fold metallo-hydrolase n=1 Tax=Zarconia navalis LEGE 11467 TaxID=1828826 RepID=A0A928Z736_9CYAN|nr:MBL fold metallo-hydrolase [Zarconia navalis]MBE9041047.1 MBL fold metallo-hydrolase [Zarconia navalis LEGE 11467]